MGTRAFNRPRFALWLTVVFAAVALVGACGGDDENEAVDGQGEGGAAGADETTQAQAGKLSHAGAGPSETGGAGDTEPTGAAGGNLGGAGNGGMAPSTVGGGPDGNGGVSAGGAAGTGETAGAGGAAGVGGAADEPHKLVFVLSEAHDGNLGGVAGADDVCQASADAANLSGTFKAWLSGSTLASSPSVRFTHATVPYRLVDGTLVAEDWADLTDGTLAHPIDMTELGTAYTSFVFSSTLSDGTPGVQGDVDNDCYGSGGDCHCNDWTIDATTGTPTPGSGVAQAYAESALWTDYSFGNFCGEGFPFYCFEQ